MFGPSQFIYSVYRIRLFLTARPSSMNHMEVHMMGKRIGQWPEKEGKLLVFPVLLRPAFKMSTGEKVEFILTTVHFHGSLQWSASRSERMSVFAGYLQSFIRNLVAEIEEYCVGTGTRRLVMKIWYTVLVSRRFVTVVDNRHFESRWVMKTPSTTIYFAVTWKYCQRRLSGPINSLANGSLTVFGDGNIRKRFGR